MNMKSRRRIQLLVLAIAVLTAAVAISACGSDSSDGDSGDSSEPIKIGNVTGLTGSVAGFDMPAVHGAELAVEDINADGGIDGRKLELVKEDTHSDLSRVGAATRSAIDAGAVAIIPTNDYNFGTAAAKAAEEDELISVAWGGDPRFGAIGTSQYFFNSGPTTPVEGGAMAQFAWDEGHKSAYFLADTSLDYSKSGCDFAKKSWTALGGNVAGEDSFENADASIQSQVDKMKNNGDVDVVFLCSYPPGDSTAVRQIRSGGVDAPIVSQAAFGGRLAAEAVKGLSDVYWVGAGLLDANDDEKLSEIGKRYMKGNSDTSSLQDFAVLTGYANVQIIAEAMRKSGSTSDGNAMRDALQDGEPVATIFGDLTYTPECHVDQQWPFKIEQIQNGKVSTLPGTVKATEVAEAPC